MGLVRGHLMVQGQVYVSVEVQISGWRKGTGHEGSERWFEDKCLLGLAVHRSKKLTYHQEQRSEQFYW